MERLPENISPKWWDLMVMNAMGSQSIKNRPKQIQANICISSTYIEFPKIGRDFPSKKLPFEGPGHVRSRANLTNIISTSSPDFVPPFTTLTITF